MHFTRFRAQYKCDDHALPSTSLESTYPKRILTPCLSLLSYADKPCLVINAVISQVNALLHGGSIFHNRTRIPRNCSLGDCDFFGIMVPCTKFFMIVIPLTVFTEPLKPTRSWCLLHVQVRFEFVLNQLCMPCSIY